MEPVKGFLSKRPGMSYPSQESFKKALDDCPPGGAVQVPEGMGAKTLGDLIAARIVETKDEAVNHPKHYTQHPSGVECIQITEHMNFCLGNAIKYVWRAGLKAEDPIEDLKKARFYIEREIKRLGGSV